MISTTRPPTATCHSRSRRSQADIWRSFPTSSGVWSAPICRGPVSSDASHGSGAVRPRLALPPVVVGAARSSPRAVHVAGPGNDNYFKAGEYYLENVAITVKNQTVVAGFPYSAGDSAKSITSVPDSPTGRCRCDVRERRHTVAQRSISAEPARSTSTRGELEIFRRLIERDLSEHLRPRHLRCRLHGQHPRLEYNDWILETKSGSNNDIAMHGLFWAPRHSQPRQHHQCRQRPTPRRLGRRPDRHPGVGFGLGVLHRHRDQPSRSRLPDVSTAT